MELLRLLYMDLDVFHGELNQAPRDLFRIRGCAYFKPSGLCAEVDGNSHSGVDGDSWESRLHSDEDGRHPGQTEKGGSGPRSDAGASQ